VIEIDIPGYHTLELNHLVLDFNGTLACDGILLSGVAERLNKLAFDLSVYVITADTFGKAKTQLEDVDCKITILNEADQAVGKRQFVEQLGASQCVCIGNGRNDQLMLKAAGLGIAVVLEEGVSVETMTAADVVCTDILNALDLLTHPLRLVATLRS
jgi:soluble P-type ATPase